MRNEGLDRAELYFEGSFTPAASDLSVDDAQLFALRDKIFHENYDDWYRSYYAHYGDRVAPVKALVKHAITAFKATYGHMPLCYKNCAISSGTNPHLDAVIANYHDTDKLDRVIGTEKHTWHNIIDNSTRSLARAHRVHSLYPEMYLTTPAAFEGSTRVFSNGNGQTLTGGLPFDGGDYMSFWNMVIDLCEGFILDDPSLDMPTIERVMREISLAQANSSEKRERMPIQTSDWANSRNSILEMARGNYIRFGLHPLRPDARMDMRFYDEATHSLYPATLLACVKPVVQNILRWAPQGIATHEACRTVARLFNLHRMRIDPEYNAAQKLSLDLKNIAPVLRDPSQAEIHEFNTLIKQFEPFLLKYCAHLIRPEGLPEHYQKAYNDAPLQSKDIGKTSVAWQRQNIPADIIPDLWALTLPTPYDPSLAFEKRSPIHGSYVPPRRQHDYAHEAAPFAKATKSDREIWVDRPFDDLDEMQQDLARMTVGVLETGLLPLDSPDYHGVRFDMKRGMPALEQAAHYKVKNLALLPGVMGKAFKEKVGESNWQLAQERVSALKTRQFDNGAEVSAVVFGAPQIRVINNTLQQLRSDFTGPGPVSPSSDFRLALEMEMLRRSYTHLTFQDGWEISEDSARLMLQATKIELGKVQRPGDNHTELGVYGEDGHYISLFERYESLRVYLDKLAKDPEIQKAIVDRDPQALKDLGVRHVSLALARLIEVYDCLVDPLFNQGRFELQKSESQAEFSKDMHLIHKTKVETVKALLDQWVWLWSDQDFKGLRQDYRDAWVRDHGDMGRHVGPVPTDDEGVIHRYGL